MDSGFSSVLKLTNLDDFITPSQECIKPIQIEKVSSGTGSKIKIEDDGSYIQISEAGEKSKLGRVDISLTDCLACSGCITTAETVLINQQSHHEMLRVFSNKASEGHKLIVVSCAVQPILSLAAANHLSPQQTFYNFSGFLKRLGADMVIDMGIAEDLALIEEEKEFLRRYKEFADGNKSALPMLASTCPGWVCYAEKTKDHLLPHLSTCRSPQQVMGALVKRVLAPKSGLRPSEVYHVAVMPCYDKKLEASRAQFTIQEVRDVDCVITPVEISLLLSEQCPDGLGSEQPGSIEWPWPLPPPTLCDTVTRAPGSASGGYAHRVANAAAQKLTGQPKEVVFKDVKRSDVQEATVEVGGGQTVKVAIVTGFRNIQNLVNRMKRGKSDYHYIEVMACPSGCLNGGAQVKGQLREVVAEHSTLPLRHAPLLPHDAHDLLFGSDSPADLHTTFQAVTYDPNPLNIKW